MAFGEAIGPRVRPADWHTLHCHRKARQSSESAVLSEVRSQGISQGIECQGLWPVGYLVARSWPIDVASLEQAGCPKPLALTGWPFESIVMS
jgi:hypothetical protein